MSIGYTYSVSEFAEFADWLQQRRERSGHTVKAALGALAVRIPSGAADSALGKLSCATDETERDLEAAIDELRAQNDALFSARVEVEGEAAHLHDLFDLAPVAYVVTDANGRISRANQAARSLLSRSANALVGRPLVYFVASPDRGGFISALLRATETSGVSTWPVRLAPPGTDAEKECRVRVRASSTTANPATISLYWAITDESDDELF